jgi:Phage tail assembly chaperone protein, TAC
MAVAVLCWSPRTFWDATPHELHAAAEFLTEAQGKSKEHGR